MSFFPLHVSEQMEWSDTANCYAYACNCQYPKGGEFGGAIPGAIGGKPAFAGAQYEERLIAGAVADGLIKVDASEFGSTAPEKENFYLVALFCNTYGFHWMRQDPYTKRWSWKAGNSGDVFFNAYNIVKQRYVYINSDNFMNLSTKASDYALSFTQVMSFASFFNVPVPGISVASVQGASLKK